MDRILTATILSPLNLGNRIHPALLMLSSSTWPFVDCEKPSRIFFTVSSVMPRFSSSHASADLFASSADSFACHLSIGSVTFSFRSDKLVNVSATRAMSFALAALRAKVAVIRGLTAYDFRILTASGREQLSLYSI